MPGLPATEDNPVHMAKTVHEGTSLPVFALGKAP